MKFGGYIKTSLIDWPGKINAVIFTGGCNFRCPYCHNSHLVDRKKIRRLPLISEEKIIADLRRRKKWLDGVVITGGEPTIQPDLGDFLKKVKKLGFATMIETNGSSPGVIRNLIIRKLVNYMAMDYKGPLAMYPEITRIKNEELRIMNEIRTTLKLLLKSKIPFELRTTVVPTIHDKKVLVKMAKEIRRLAISHPPSVRPSWFLQNFQPKNCLDPEFEKIRPFTKVELENFLKAVKKIIPEAQLCGV